MIIHNNDVMNLGCKESIGW